MGAKLHVHPKEPSENGKSGEICEFAVPLNVLLGLPTTQTAESEGLAGLRYLNIISAQITGVPVSYVGVGETFGSQ